MAAAASIGTATGAASAAGGGGRRRRRRDLGQRVAPRPPAPPVPAAAPVASPLLGGLFGGDDGAGENPQRHELPPGRQRPPRPLGAAPGMPWEPRVPTRSHAGTQLTVRFLEALEAVPWLQGIAAAAMRVIFWPATRGDAGLPPDVPDPAGSWKFAALGDYGAGSPQQARVAANILRGSPELVITAGDNVYPTGRWQDYAKNWDPPHLMGNLARSVPFMPALGNHDMYRDDLRPYFGHFPHLKGRTYYAFTHRNAHFIALDGDQDLRKGSAQYRWLERELRTSSRQWKVVYLHYPMYGSSLDAYPEIREALQPLLKRFGVQLVVAGHEHNYLRSHPVDGVTHLLTGGGGQQVYPFTAGQPKWLARRKDSFHHVEVSVGTSSLVVRAIDEHGKRIDTAVIKATGPVGDAQRGAASVGARRKRRQRAAGPSGG